MNLYHNINNGYVSFKGMWIVLLFQCNLESVQIALKIYEKI